MAGIWRNNPATPEGKYPIVLRRDGTPVESPYFVILLKDPAAEAAIRAYARAAEHMGWDEQYVSDLKTLADSCRHERLITEKPADPDAPAHRKDDPVVIAWARSIGSPGA